MPDDQGPTLAEALSRASELVRTMGGGWFDHPTDATALKKRARQVERRFQGVEAREPARSDLDKIARELGRQWATRRGLQELPRKVLCRACWVLFREDFPYSRNPAFVDAYIDAALDRFSGRDALRLLHVWLRDFPQGSQTFAQWRRGLETILERLRSSKNRRAQAAVERAEKTHCLEERGARAFALEFGESASPARMLSSVELKNELGRGEFMRSTISELTKILRRDLRRQQLSATRLKAILDDLWLDGGQPRFEDLHSSTAEALLIPYADGTVSCDDELRQVILTRVIGWLDDPRLHPQRWNRVSSEAQVVVRRWLTGLTLEAFFKVLDATAVDRQWRFRRKFWNAYFESGYLSEAWAAFGRMARLRADRGRFIEDRQYGTLDGALSNHSVLIMKIGRLTIAEWSHSGQCWVWKPDSKDAPPLYRQTYSKDDLTGPNTGRGFSDHWIRSEDDFRSARRRQLSPVGFWHMSSNRYLWQGRARQHIYELTRIDIPETEFT